MYFVWGLMKRPSLGQKDRIEPAESFLENLNQKNATIVLPTPMMQELLMTAEASERAALYVELGEKFFIAEFDAQCAKLAAEIWNTKKRAGVIDALKKSGDSMRTKIKVDIQILATAIQNHATTFYTNDDKLAKLAEGYIVVADMPEVTKQLELDLAKKPMPPQPDFPTPPPPPRLRNINIGRDDSQ